MRSSDQLRYRTATAIPSYPTNSERTARRLSHQLPTMLWPQWSLRFTLAPCSGSQMRAALSAAIMLVGTKLNLTDAAHRTGSAVTAAGMSRSLQLLSNDARWSDTLTALARLADYLSITAVPIDYQRRRHLDYQSLLPDTLWAQICQQTATTPGAGLKADVVRCLLFERLSGLPASRSPFAANTYEFRGTAAAFPRNLTPDLMSHLNQAARQFLDDHDLTDEPVTWQPPLGLLGGLDLPGRDPSSVDITELHRLVRHERLAFSDVAGQLGTTIDTVRYILETHPAPALRTPAQNRARGRTFAALKTQLPEATLVDLYQHQRCSLNQIGHRVGCNEKIIARLARMYGIPVRTAADRPRVVIERDWLYDQYVTRRRTLTDLAREVGVSVSQMSRYAKAYEIPITPTGGRSYACFRGADVVAAEFPILGPALTDSFSWDRLQRFAVAADHPSLRSAAKTLGTHQTCLFKQVDRLERDLGGQLLIRTPTRYQPMQLTPLGTDVVAAVRRRLKANGIDANPDGTEDTQRFVRQTGFELP